MQRLLNFLIALDMFVFSVITLGKSYPGETISGACYRAELLGLNMRYLRPVVDWLFSPFEKEHCKSSYIAACQNVHVPQDMRTK